MANNNGVWQCPSCLAKAKVEGRNIKVFVPPTLQPRWPLHPDCELAKDTDHINFSQLTKVG